MTDAAGRETLLAERENDRYRLRLFLSEDGLTCTARMSPGAEAGPGPSLDEILDMLASAEVTEGIDQSAVSQAASLAPADFPPEGIDLARGVPPVAPHDGHIELSVRPDAGIAEYAVRADGSVDFHARSEYDLVAEAQDIGTFHPPKAGRPGVTVTGHAIPVPSPTISNIVFGKGVRIDRESNRILATSAGRVLFVDNHLSVEEEYVVRGDVDFSVGNIRNTGFVTVAGDVNDNFTVTGDKGIKVGGIVGAATLVSDGDITVAGVSGKGKGRIVCGGTFRARFLNEADVECRGDVIVESEIRTSTVQAGGMILAPNGIVASGACIAGRGIEVKTAGTNMGVITALAAGTDYRQRKALESLKEKLRALEKEIAKLESSAGAAPPDEQALARMSPVRREAVEKLWGALTAARTDALTFRDEIARTNLENDPNSNAMINVRGEIHEGTIVALWHADVLMNESRKGPITIIENSIDGTLRFLPLQPLKRNARDIEAAILAAEGVSRG